MKLPWRKSEARRSGELACRGWKEMSPKGEASKCWPEGGRTEILEQGMGRMGPGSGSPFKCWRSQVEEVGWSTEESRTRGGGWACWVVHGFERFLLGRCGAMRDLNR